MSLKHPLASLALGFLAYRALEKSYWEKWLPMSYYYDAEKPQDTYWIKTGREKLLETGHFNCNVPS